MLSLDRKKPFIRALYRALADETHIIEAADILYSLEKQFGLCFYDGEDDDFINNLAPQTEQERKVFLSNQMYPFLSSSQMLLTGSETNIIEVIANQRQIYEPTMRVWGHDLAAWANTYWQPKPTTPTDSSTYWNYLDFYMSSYPKNLIADYPALPIMMLKVIEFKSQIYGRY